MWNWVMFVCQRTRSRRERPFSKSTSRSTSLDKCSSPRAVDPKSEMDLAPCRLAILMINSLLLSERLTCSTPYIL